MLCSKNLEFVRDIGYSRDRCRDRAIFGHGEGDGLLDCFVR